MAPPGWGKFCFCYWGINSWLEILEERFCFKAQRKHDYNAASLKNRGGQDANITALFSRLQNFQAIRSSHRYAATSGVFPPGQAIYLEQKLKE
jgi:hypothetical protein